jgi:membrane protein DedA with SNARE-associated domain
MMGMGYGRFLLIDAAGALLSVPASIYLGKLFGGSLESLERGVKDLNLILGFLVLSLALILILRSRRARAARAEPVAADAICEELPADGGAAESPRRTP